MKKFKVGFTVIIAVLAIGLTIAAQAGAFDAKKTLAEADCFDVQSATGTPIEVRTNCTTPVFLSSSLSCTQTHNGKAIFSLNPADIVSNPTLDCPSSSGVMCCVLIEPVDEAICDDQPEFEIVPGNPKPYVVELVRCRTAQ